jgi:hypothetical protein
MLDLKIFAQEEIEDLVKGDIVCYPEAMQFIMTRLECTEEELRVVKPQHKPTTPTDIEAWFPNEPDKPLMIWEIPGYDAELIEIHYRGVSLIGLRDECPYMVYMNVKDLQHEKQNVA